MGNVEGERCELPGLYDGNISASSFTTQASHSRAHGAHPCRALVATYLRVPTAFAWCDRGNASTARGQGCAARDVLLACTAKPAT
jgi:hypothetical protein